MSSITEVTLVGLFPDDVLMELGKPLNGTRLRRAIPPEPPYVSDILTGAFKDTPPARILDFVQNGIGDYSGVLVLDEDTSDKTRVVRFTHGEWDVDTGDGNDD